MMVAKLELERFRAHVGPNWHSDFFDAIDELPDDEYLVVYVDDSLLRWEGHGAPSGIPFMVDPGQSHCPLAWAIVRWRNTAGLRGTLPPGW